MGDFGLFFTINCQRWDYMKGTLSQEKYFSFLKAVENYRTYIDLLPDGSDTVLFSYDRFKDGVFQ